MKTLGVYGGSFNPPALHHVIAAQCLSAYFDQLIIQLAGNNRIGKKLISFEHRQNMIPLAFGQIPKIAYDLNSWEVFIPTWDLYHIYQHNYPRYTIKIIIGSDLLIGGPEGNSEIQQKWYNGNQVYTDVHFYVLQRKGYEICPSDYPKNFEFARFEVPQGSSSHIRELIQNNQDFSHLVPKKVFEYIKEHFLYLSE